MTGDALRRLVESPPTPAPPCVERFLYQPCAMMITGETGRGKSVIAANLALACTSATPLFGALAIPTPRRVYYLQLEGSSSEQYRRLSYMVQRIPWNPDLLYWDSNHPHPLWTLSHASATRKYDQIAHAFTSPPELVIIDPIYKAAGGDVAKAEVALSVIAFSDRLMNGLGCSVVLIHHPHRERFVNGKKLEEEDWYYGHSFLKNHIEVSYAFKSLDAEGQYGELLLKKRREENVHERLHLCYHPETYTCSLVGASGEEANKRTRIEDYLRGKAVKGETTDFYEVRRAFDISATFLRELQLEWVRQALLTVTTTPGKKSVWIPHDNQGVRS